MFTSFFIHSFTDQPTNAPHITQDLRLGLQNLHQDYIAELASWPVSKAAAEAAAAAAKKQQQQQQALTQQKQAPAAQQSLTLQPQQSTTIPSSTAIVQQDQGKQQEGFGLYPGEKKEQAQAPPTTQLTLQQQWPQYPRVLSKTVLIQHDLAKQGSSSGPYPIIYPRQTQKQQLQLPPPQPKAPALPAPQQQQAPSAEQLAKYPIVRESTVLVQTELGKQGSSTGPYPAIYPFVKEQHEQQLKLAQQTPQKQITAAQPVAQQQQVTSAQPAEQPKVESSTTYPNVRAFASPITPAQIKEFTEAHISKDSPKTDAHRALHYPKIN